MIRLASLAFLSLLAAPLVAQGPLAAPCVDGDVACVAPDVPREFRGVWVATVGNLDWPSRPGLPTDSAQAELLAILDRAAASGLNAVIFQVRPSGDALYASPLEPWSEYLTGRQGTAPAPRWDPLAFAVEEAHRRGLELHAWFNPYRAKHPSAKGPLASSHLARRRPSLVRTYGKHLWMDPGEPAVLAHTLRVILDVVNRYDIDAVHLDDYFYPYEERTRRGRPIAFPDADTYRRYRAGGGALDRDDWRRSNVDALVRALHEGIHRVKPWVKFGVSPFGIWRPGHPEAIRGFDAYAELYADARTWVREGWLDYVSPQLYWPLGKPEQSYPALLRWWGEQNVFGRHLWPGNFTSKVADGSRTPWTATEIMAQIAVTRADSLASGNIHFSAQAFLRDRDLIATRLAEEAYRAPALVPASPWLALPPLGPVEVSVATTAEGAPYARLEVPSGERPRWWVVQEHAASGAWRTRVLPGSLREIPLSAPSDHVAVRAIDRAGNERAVRALRIEARGGAPD
jgi:uncharacterized lipoprotein YddW (UPF0748 family)